MEVTQTQQNNNEKRTKYLYKYIREIISAIFWIYILIKLFVYDIG
jgi:hypothetical protein